jgi:hypothetical protein
MMEMAFNCNIYQDFNAIITVRVQKSEAPHIKSPSHPHFWDYGLQTYLQITFHYQKL